MKMRPVIVAFQIIIVVGMLTSCGKLVYFKTAPGYAKSSTVGGRIIMPEGKGPFPAVILLHGCGGIEDNHHMWASYFVKCGYVAMILDSFTERNIADICSGGGVSEIERTMDAFAAAQYLNQQSYVETGQIGIIGFSHGGNAVLSGVRKDAVNFANSTAFPYKAGVALYPYCQPGYTNIVLPTLVLIGSEDKSCSSDACLQLSKMVNPELFRVVVYEGATHAFDLNLRDRLWRGHMLSFSAQATLDAKEQVKLFFDKYLKKNQLAHALYLLFAVR